jgi:hypothetical protein
LDRRHRNQSPAAVILSGVIIAVSFVSGGKCGALYDILMALRRWTANGSRRWMEI